jgi:hypothetical protein
MSPQLINKIKLIFCGKSNGSAITEFLIFTLPFFAALLLITLNLYQHSMATNEAKNLARQSLRAFITSPNNEIAEARGNQVLEIYRDNLSSQDFNNRNFEIKFECSNNPCLSPGGSVSAYLRVSMKGQKFREITGSATEYVDLWR